MWKPSNRNQGVILFAVIGAWAWLWASPAAAQIPVLIYADYGAGDSRVDVTTRIQSMIANGYLNVRVNNDTLGGDPAPGHSKELRLHVRERNDRIRDIGFREGTTASLQLEVSTRDYEDDHFDAGPLIILRAYYGISSRTVDVTRRLRGMVGAGELRLRVDNETMGGDPAPEHGKVLFVLFQYQGERKAVIMHEEDDLRLP